MKNTSIVYKNVKLGPDFKIEQFCIIGKAPRGKKQGEVPLTIGKGALIRDFSTIYAGSIIGDLFQTGSMAFIREDNVVGNNVSIGTGAILEVGNRIGNNVRIHSGCFLELAVIDDDVFLGPNVVLTDDIHPPCRRFKECVGGVRIGKGASIGGNVTILPGITIGKGALVGAGSVVTKDVKDNTVVVGNPARFLKKTSEIKCIKKFFSSPYKIIN